MIEACRRTGTILAIAAHLNWYAPYTNAKALIDSGEIGALRSMTCLSPFSLSNMHSHTLCLFRLFAGAPAKWVFGQMDAEEAAAGDEDLVGSGMVGYENGVTAFINSGAPRRTWSLELKLRARPYRLPERACLVRAVGTGRRRARRVPAAVPVPVAPPAAPWSTPSRASRGPSSPASRRRAPASSGARRWRSESRCGSRTAAAASESTCRWPTAACAWGSRFAISVQTR